MEEATSSGNRGDTVVARSLLRMALALLDRDRQYGAAASVASALDRLGEPLPDEERLMAWLDECEARAALPSLGR